MRSIIACLSRAGPVILAAIGPLFLAACASEPAQLGTPEYALERLFSNRPYRSTDQMLAAQPRPAASAPAAATGEGPIAEGGAVGEDGGVTRVPAAVTRIELNEWYAFPLGGAYAYGYPYSDRSHPRYVRPWHYYSPRGSHPGYVPKGYRRCVGVCSGLRISIGEAEPRVRAKAGYHDRSTAPAFESRVPPPLHTRRSVVRSARGNLTPPPQVRTRR